MNHWSHRVFLIALVSLLSGIALSAETAKTNSSMNAEAQKQVIQIEKELAGTETDLDTLWKSLSKIRLQAKECITEQNLKLEKLALVLTELGQSTKGEDKDVADTRKEKEKDKQIADLTLASCKLLGVKSEALLEETRNRRESILKERLMTRSPNLVAALINQEQATIDWKSLLSAVKLGDVGFYHLSVTGWVMLLLVTLVAIAVTLFLRRQTRGYLSRHLDATDFTSAMLNSMVRAVERYGLGILLLSAWGLFWFADSWQQKMATPLLLISLVLLGFFITLTLGRAFFSPLPPVRHYLPQPEQGCRRFWRGLYLLAMVTAAGPLLYLMPISVDLPPLIESLLRAAFATVVVFSLTWVVWDALILYGRRGLHLFRVLLILALMIGLGAEYAGYRNLSEYLIGGILFSLLLIGSAWLLSMLFSDFCDSLDESRYNREIGLRQWLGIEPGGYLPGVFWLRMLGGIFLWGGSALILLRIWDVSSSKRAELLAYITDGFTIGTTEIMPGRIIIALAVLVILMSVISWLKKQLDERWLKTAHMEVGARNAVASVVSYAAAAIAIVTALGFAGVQLGNLAIIAGALSVGIGFGLQNIVNNFVSGLILLFERPVQKGDWVVVGSTEGYVKKISIRSTQIQTFDRADVIVPNSELISNQVTNWTLRDLRGRVRVPIGVAYGSDVEKVKELLLKIAHELPNVILDNSVSLPQVLFMSFGDSSLNLELRFFIRNVDERMQTLSRVNYSIDRVFRENGIQIPFPQRDVHLPGWPFDKPTVDPVD